MTLNGAINQLHELRSAEDMPIYYKPAIAEVINVLLMDAREAKRGRWVKVGQSFLNPNNFRNYSCSECGYDIEKVKLNYCPNCGADMRKGEEE